MIINRNFCKFVAVLFYFELILSIAFAVVCLVLGFHFSGTIWRIILLIGGAAVASKFYNFIIDDTLKDGEDKGNFIIKGELEYKRLIPIIIVLSILIISITLLVILDSL